MLQTAGQPIFMPPNMYQQPIPQQSQPQFQQQPSRYFYLVKLHTVCL